MKRWVRVLFVLALVQAALVGVYQLRTTEEETVVFTPLNRAGPELTFETATGAQRSLSDARGAVVVHLWATWCPPCVEELPAVLEFAEDSTLPVLAVSVDPNWKTIRTFLGRAPPASVVRATSSSVAEAFGVDTLPQTFIVDKEGWLGGHLAGTADWRSEAFRQSIANAAKRN